MYNRTETILEAYPYEFTDIRKGRGAYLCTAKQGGRMILKQFSGSQSRIENLNQLLIYLKESGWKAEQILQTKEEQLLYHGVEDTDFYLRSWFDGRECDTKNRDEILQAVQKLAKFHLLVSNYSGPLPDTLRQEDLKGRYARYTKELHKVYHYIRTRKRKNDFETAFLQEYAHYLGQAETALQQLEQIPPADGRQLGVCHGDFHHHNILFLKREIVFINYEHFCIDLYVSDLANFFRKLMEKHNWQYRLGMDMLEAYESVRPLDGTERWQLYLRMAYPEKFRKVADHYANSKKNWANHRDCEKLQKISAQEKERVDFLCKFYDWIKD